MVSKKKRMFANYILAIDTLFLIALYFVKLINLDLLFIEVYLELIILFILIIIDILHFAGLIKYD